MVVFASPVVQLVERPHLIFEDPGSNPACDTGMLLCPVPFL
jgi:hypothetical protein